MRLLVRLLVGLATAAVALLVAAALLDGLRIDIVAFPVVVVVFTVVGALARPLIESTIEEYVQLLASFVGLVAAFVTLLITDLVTARLEVEGLTTWLVAPAVLWVSGIAADLMLGRWLARRLLGDRA
jgi:uncharacterized membrane protein YvlD (DUF360 family)